MGQTILACDDHGNFIQYIPKAVGHSGLGRRHLAIAVLLKNRQDQVLLQKRKHQIFNNLWDVTAATHPLHRADGSDETLEEATRRCLEVECGIKDNIALNNVGFFNYFAPYHTVQGEYCENEHCCLMLGEYNGQIKMDPITSYEYKWEDKDQFLQNIKNNPDQFTPWTIEGVKLLKQAKFFNHQPLDKVMSE